MFVISFVIPFGTTNYSFHESYLEAAVLLLYCFLLVHASVI